MEVYQIRLFLALTAISAVLEFCYLTLFSEEIRNPACRTAQELENLTDNSTILRNIRKFPSWFATKSAYQ